ncbi:hypothetical protein JCM16303_003181 [Sporobolomyces ruberrimus]
MVILISRQSSGSLSLSQELYQGVLKRDEEPYIELSKAINIKAGKDHKILFELQGVQFRAARQLAWSRPTMNRVITVKSKTPNKGQDG